LRIVLDIKLKLPHPEIELLRQGQMPIVERARGLRR